MLRYYPSDRHVIGVDLSVHMLGKAVEKVRDLGLSHVKLLASMDACRLGFRDESFDAVAVPFVITLVPNPEAALDEIRRVLRPGGEIVVTSKLGVDTGLHAWAEEMLAPLMGKIGWSSHFKVSRLERWAATHPDMQVVEVAPVFPAGFFKLVRIRKRGGFPSPARGERSRPYESRSAFPDQLETDERQQEIDELVERLGRHAPD